jgi:hypothetical protein
MRRMPRLILAAALLAALFATTAFAASGGPTATAARACSSGDGRGLGATYVQRIRTRGVSCRRAIALIKDYHACRRRRGGADGRCPRVNGYRCREDRFADSPRQYDSRATCRRGGRRVAHTYTQNK